MDFLSSIVGTPLATDPAYERFDYINDPDPLVTSDDGVQAEEIARLQCFIDSGLSSGFVGDADQDGMLDCDDIASAASQPFAGEAFPAAAYKVKLDADLDGDNDASDKDAVADALLALEPANQFFDGALNVFDFNEYISRYNAMDPRADLFPVGAPDGVFNIFDVQQFTADYNTPFCLPDPTP